MKFDFNVDTYTLNDLAKVFNLPDNYDKQLLEQNEIIWYQNILNNSKYDLKTKQNLYVFLKNAKKKLLDILASQDDVKLLGSPHNFNPVKHTELSNVYNYNYQNGVINPIERQTMTKVVCINSLFRNNFFNTNSSSFDYVFPTPIENVIKMKVSFVEMPVFWYDVSSKLQNNVFTIKLFNMNMNGTMVAEKTHQIIIQDGTYTSNIIVVYLNNYFYSVKEGLQFLVCSISEVNSKFSIRATNVKMDALYSNAAFPFENAIDNTYYSPDFYFQIIFNETPFSDYKNTDNLHNPYVKSMANILGFKHNEYTITAQNTQYDYSNAITYSCFLESEYSYGRYIYQYLFLEINDYNKNFSTNSVISLVGNNNYVGDNIILVIPITTNANTIMYNNSANDGIIKCREYFGPVRLTKLTIRILDQFGNVLDLNGYDYFIVLELEQLYNNYNMNL